MTTPIDNDLTTTDGSQGATETNEAEENASGVSVSVTEAIGAKKSFIDQPIPTNTSTNPMQSYQADASAAHYGAPLVINSSNITKPKYKAGNSQDQLRTLMRKFWLPEQSNHGLIFKNKNTHKQGYFVGQSDDDPIGEPNDLMPRIPITLHIEKSDITYAYKNAQSIPALGDLDDPGVPALYQCSDKIEDPRIKPDHPEHADFIHYVFGMSKHDSLVGDEKLERIVFSYTPAHDLPNDSLGAIINKEDWKYFVGSNDIYAGPNEPGSNYVGFRLDLPVYDNIIPGENPTLESYRPTQISPSNPSHMFSQDGIDMLDFNKNILLHPMIANGSSNKTLLWSWQIARIDRQDNSFAQGKTNFFHKLPVYHDHTFSLSTPTNVKKLTDENTKIKTMVYDIKTEYNMFLQNYETAIKWETIPESLLPNIYIFLSELNNEDLTNLIYYNHITLNQNLLPDYVQQWLGDNGGFMKAKEAVQSQAPSAYFKEYANRIREISEGSESGPLVELYSRTAFTFDGLKDVLNDARARSFLFPMNVNLSFNTDKKTFISQLMKEARLTGEFSKALGYGQVDVTTPLPYNGYSQESRQYKDLGTGERRVESITDAMPPKDYRTWDLNDFILAIDVLGQDMYGAFPTDQAQLGYGEKVDMTAPENVLYKYLMTKLFSGKAKKFIKENTRSYLDILKGKQAYNETLFYKIEKRRMTGQDDYTEYYGGAPDPTTSPEEGTLVQSIMIPNSNELDVFEYIDTQVKYGYKYDYTVTAYQLVLGTEYQTCRTFTSLVESLAKGEDGKPVANNPHHTALTHVLSRPSPKIVEVPYFGNTNTDRATACVMDDPPVPPDFEILPYKGYANKVLVNFAPNTGEYMQDPITIEEMDFKKFSDVYIAQNISPPEGPVRFSSDEPVAVFEAYRTTKAPYSYDDFKEKRIRQLFFEPPEFLSSFVDDVQPNKKYYYTFRAVDGHSWISNPTPVMQVELVENDGATYLLQEEYKFPNPEDDLTTTKNVKKYLYIEPAQAQIAIDYSRMELELDDSAYNMPEGEIPALGISNETLVGKKFKIRIKSKNTGKVFDINFVFNQDHLPVDQSSLSYYLNTLIDNADENENI